MQLSVVTATLGLVLVGRAAGQLTTRGADERAMPAEEERSVAGEDVQEPPCDCMFWTPWINADQPDNTTGDLETLGYNVPLENGYAGAVTRLLAERGIVCNTPARVQCRSATTGQPWIKANDTTIQGRRINCRRDTGMVCLNGEQADGTCNDYEIRLLCWQPCERLQWVDWINRDTTTGDCDCEGAGLHDHPVRHSEPCPDGGTPYDIDCQTVDGTHAALTNNRNLTCNINDGFFCFHDFQPGTLRCPDYRVSYLCPTSQSANRIGRR